MNVNTVGKLLNMYTRNLQNFFGKRLKFFLVAISYFKMLKFKICISPGGAKLIPSNHCLLKPYLPQPGRTSLPIMPLVVLED